MHLATQNTAQLSEWSLVRKMASDENPMSWVVAAWMGFKFNLACYVSHAIRIMQQTELTSRTASGTAAMRRAAHCALQTCSFPDPWARLLSSAQNTAVIPRPFASVTTHPSQSSALSRHLLQKIQMRGGPITLAEFMQDVLTSPHGGFYMHRDVFGSSGDFITSPEISQMFGEMVGVWCAHTWQQMGQPAQLALVELGPGRGTLMADMLRATRKFTAFSASLELHLVEVSPALRQLQYQALRCTPSKLSSTPPGAHMNSATPAITDGMCGLNAAHVTWHAVADSVPRTMPVLFIAHEFFDALPVHQFVKDPRRGWVEKLVDTDTETHDSASTSSGTVPGSAPDAAPVQPASDSGNEAPTPSQPVSGSEETAGTGTSTTGSSSRPAESKPSASDSSASSSGRSDNIEPSPVGSRPRLIGSTSSPIDSKPRANDTAPSTSAKGDGLRLVLSPSTTPAATLLVRRRLGGMPLQEAESCQALEVCAHGMALAESLALRIGRQGGAALIIDYGKDGPYSDSLMAIKGHQGAQVLDDPGAADLSAWVDFGALRQAAQGSGTPVSVHGPVSQASFLLSLGIQYRLQQLLKDATVEEAETLTAGFNRLVDEEMGRTYQAMAITHSTLPVPAGFPPASAPNAVGTSGQ